MKKKELLKAMVKDILSEDTSDEERTDLLHQFNRLVKMDENEIADMIEESSKTPAIVSSCEAVDTCPFTFASDFNQAYPGVIHYKSERDIEHEKRMGHNPVLDPKIQNPKQYIDAYNGLLYDVSPEDAKFIESVLQVAWDFYDERYLYKINTGGSLEANTIPYIVHPAFMPTDPTAEEPCPQFPDFAAYYYSDMVTFAYLLADVEKDKSNTKKQLTFETLIKQNFNEITDNIISLMFSDICLAFDKFTEDYSDFKFTPNYNSFAYPNYPNLYSLDVYIGDSNNHNTYLSYYDGSVLPKVAFLTGNTFKNAFLAQYKEYHRKEMTPNLEFTKELYRLNNLLMPVIYDYIQHTLFEIAMHASFTYALLQHLDVEGIESRRRVAKMLEE